MKMFLMILIVAAFTADGFFIGWALGRDYGKRSVKKCFDENAENGVCHGLKDCESTQDYISSKCMECPFFTYPWSDD